MPSTPNPAPLGVNTAALGAATSSPYTLADRFAFLAEELCLIEGGGVITDDSALDPRLAELFVRQADDARNSQIAAVNADKRRVAFVENLKLSKESYFENLKAYYEQGGTSDPYVVAFPNVPVLFDRDREQWYVTLPKAFTDLPRYTNLPREEQVSIEPMAYNDRVLRSYMPMPGYLSSQMVGLYAEGLQGVIGHLREGKNEFFLHRPGDKVVDETVLVKAVVRNRDTVTPPDPGYLDAASDADVLAGAWALWQSHKMQDRTNDANPQTPR